MRLIVALGCLCTVPLWGSHVLQAMAHDFSKEDINTKYGETALHAAAYFGHEDQIESLLKAGAMIDARDICKETPLHKAVFMNRYTIARRLIEAKADVLARNNNGETMSDIFEHNRLDSSRVLDNKQWCFKEFLEDTMRQARFDDLKKTYEGQRKQTKKTPEIMVSKPLLEQKMAVTTSAAVPPSVVSHVQPVFQEEEDLNEVPADVMIYHSCVAMLRKVCSALMSCGKRCD